eukprot:2816722-Pyramimonas_sp.AAC.1
MDGAKYKMLEATSRASGAASKISGRQYFDIRISRIPKASGSTVAPAGQPPLLSKCLRNAGGIGSSWALPTE